MVSTSLVVQITYFHYQDHDRRVREATQQAFEQLILKVKRNLAPYLKSIMGHWLIAQCDTYTPASSAASAAFQAAFPLNKQPEALSFCKEEVLCVSLRSLTPDWKSELLFFFFFFKVLPPNLMQLFDLMHRYFRKTC